MSRFLDICHDLDKSEVFSSGAKTLAVSFDDMKFLVGMVDNLMSENDCLRSVLAEWDQDKTCYLQWGRANELRSERDAVDEGYGG